MRVATRGRHCLRGQWRTAVTIQGILLSANLFLLLLELGLLRLTGTGMEEMVHAGDWLTGRRAWIQGSIIAGMALLDLLVLSPLWLGQTAFYTRLACPPPAVGNTCLFDRLPARESALSPAMANATQEFTPLPATPARVPLRVVFAFYRKGYFRAVGWRARLWILQGGWGLVCMAPAAAMWGYAEVLRLSGAVTPAMEVTRLFCGLCGLFLLIAGFVVLQLILLRYLPAGYLLAQGCSLKNAFKQACRLTKGQVGALAWLYLGFTGWLVSCLLIIPYFYVAPLFAASRAAAVRHLSEISS